MRVPELTEESEASGHHQPISPGLHFTHGQLVARASEVKSGGGVLVIGKTALFSRIQAFIGMARHRKQIRLWVIRPLEGKGVPTNTYGT